MKTIEIVVLVIAVIVVGLEILFYAISPPGEKEDGAKAGAALGCSIVLGTISLYILALIIYTIVVYYFLPNEIG